MKLSNILKEFKRVDAVVDQDDKGYTIYMGRYKFTIPNNEIHAGVSDNVGAITYWDTVLETGAIIHKLKSLRAAINSCKRRLESKR